MARKQGTIDRRDFLRRAGIGAAVAGATAGYPQEAAARKRVAPVDLRAPKTGGLLKAQEVMGIGVIGVGGMGTGHLQEIVQKEIDGQPVQVRAISDVYEHRKRDRVGIVKDRTSRTIDAYTNYLDLLARDDIHGVIIATPDHWHAKIAMDAMDAGKDVYCQKPVTLTVEESVEVRDKVNATGRVFQCGAQYCSKDFYWQARKFIREGGIGKVLWAQADYSRNSGSPESPQGGEWNWAIDEQASPDPGAGEWYIDWKQWLGPAPQHPFSKPRFFQFRKFWDYSGGIATDLLYHVVAPLTLALDLSAPEKVSAAGGIYVQHDDREVPDTFMITADYPEDITLVLTSSMANRQANPLIIRGHYATIRPHDDGMQVTAENEFKEWFKGRYGAEEIIVPLEPREEHMDNWLNACRGRHACHLDAETAYRAMACVKMGCDSYREDKVMFWDNAAERAVRKHPRPERSSKIPALES